MNTLNFLDATAWLALVWCWHIHSDKANAVTCVIRQKETSLRPNAQVIVLKLLATAAVMEAT